VPVVSSTVKALYTAVTKVGNFAWFESRWLFSM